MNSSTCPQCENDRYSVLFPISDHLYRTTDKEFKLVECASCGLLRLMPWPSRSELPRYYPPEYFFVEQPGLAGKLAGAYRRLVLSDHLRFIELCLKDASEHGIILDVGCGSGLLPSLLRHRRRRVIGLDVSRRACHLAWKQYGVPSICGSLDESPLEPESCSMITLFHVLEHLFDPRRHIEAAHRLLSKDGWLIVQVPNAASWQFRLLRQRWNGLHAPRHLVNFRAIDLEVLLSSCGFEIVRRKYFSLRDNPTGIVSSLFPALDPLVRRARRLKERPAAGLIKDLLYFGFTVLALPFAVAEACGHAGATVMIGARKR